MATIFMALDMPHLCYMYTIYTDYGEKLSKKFFELLENLTEEKMKKYDFRVVTITFKEYVENEPEIKLETDKIMQILATELGDNGNHGIRLRKSND